MQIISNCTQEAINKAAQALIDGHLVAFPTETVYGLGSDANNSKAVARIYEVKARPTDHPLIVHISSINQINKWAIDIPDYAITLARKFWPGPMTLILKRSDLAKNFITGGQENVGLRVPSHPLALALLTQFESLGGEGVAAPSANRFGAVSPTTSLAVDEELGRKLSQEDLILDGGACVIGLESTIIDCTGEFPSILRPGAITLEMIKKLAGGKSDADTATKSIKASGLLENHYSPKATVRLDMPAKPGEGFIAMASIRTPVGAHRLASPVNVEEFARILYEALRNGDRINLSEIKVMLPEGEGLATAIKDRLIKSSLGTGLNKNLVR
jgi:L-threonylcarbamoyladenylate synthase